MEQRSIMKKQKSQDTITRTIRFSGKAYDKITELAEKEGVTFNYIVNQIIEYGLRVLDEQKKSNEK